MKRFTKLLILIALFEGFCNYRAAAQSDMPAQYGKPYAGVPDSRDVVMYQVNTRAFSAGGNFKGVTARLDNIKSLGVNVIYILPIYPVGTLKGQNSPYAEKDYDAVGPEFGTLQDLRELVDGAHKRKMAVILDWVGNHTSWDNKWIGNKGWYEQDSTGNIKMASTWSDVAQLNFKNNDMRLAMIRSMKAWVYKANVDGFRCDYADGPPADFWKQAIDSLRNISTHKLLFLAEGTRGDNFKAGFDYNFGFRFYENMKRIYHHNHSVKSIDTINTNDYADATGSQQMVRYVTNHDVNSEDGSPIKVFDGKAGSMAAFIVAAYMKSVPLIYNGQEVGTPYSLRFPFTGVKIDWRVNPDVTAEYKKVIAFRNKSVAIRRGEMTSYSSDDVCAFTKQAGKEQVLVLSNLRNKAVEYTVPAALANSDWKAAFSKAKTHVGASVKLGAYEYLVLWR